MTLCFKIILLVNLLKLLLFETVPYGTVFSFSVRFRYGAINPVSVCAFVIILSEFMQFLNFLKGTVLHSVFWRLDMCVLWY